MLEKWVANVECYGTQKGLPLSYLTEKLRYNVLRFPRSALSTKIVSAN